MQYGPFELNTFGLKSQIFLKQRSTDVGNITHNTTIDITDVTEIDITFKLIYQWYGFTYKIGKCTTKAARMHTVNSLSVCMTSKIFALPMFKKLL